EELLQSIGAFTVALLPENRPRYLMGVGQPQDILKGVRAGFDMFDCVIPTRNARNGTLFTSQGKLSIKRAEFANDPRPPDENCACYCCRNFSRGYLRHLYMAGEILSSQLNSFHNLYFIVIRPQQKKTKDLQVLLNKLKKNDEVMTSGGIYSKVVALAENVVTLEVAPNVRIRVHRTQITAVVTGEKSSSKEAKE